MKLLIEGSFTKVFTFQDGYVLRKYVDSPTSKQKFSLEKTVYDLVHGHKKDPDVQCVHTGIVVNDKLCFVERQAICDLFEFLRARRHVDSYVELSIDPWRCTFVWDTWSTFRNISLNIVRGMRFLHEQHVLVQDFKLENCLLFQKTTQDHEEVAQCRIADFNLIQLGVAGMYDGGASIKNHRLVLGGTFFSPEEILNRPYGLAADVYRVGLAMYTLFFDRLHESYLFRHQQDKKWHWEEIYEKGCTMKYYKGDVAEKLRSLWAGLDLSPLCRHMLEFVILPMLDHDPATRLKHCTSMRQYWTLMEATIQKIFYASGSSGRPGGSHQ